MSLFDDGCPERLWHYTSGAGAKAIFESRTLWAGHLGIHERHRDVARRLSDELPEHREALARWIKHVSDSPREGAAPNLFAVSFSEQWDLLSQWRGYATGSGGPFCLGIPSTLLKGRLSFGHDGQAWTLRKCIYSRDEQADLIETRIRRQLDSVSRTEVPPHGRTREDHAYRNIHAAVVTVAPLCKHPAFAEEREWRLIIGPLAAKKADKVHFVERQHTLAPYIDFRLAGADDGPLDNVHWMAGPGPQQQRSNWALGMVAQIAGMTKYQGAPSQTPYLP
jgi:hypothetical protein